MKFVALASVLIVLNINASSMFSSTLHSLSGIFTSEAVQPGPVTSTHKNEPISMSGSEEIEITSSPRVNSLETKSFSSAVPRDIIRYNTEYGLNLASPVFDIEASFKCEDNFIFYPTKGVIFYQDDEKQIPVAPFYPGVPEYMSVGAARLLTGLYDVELETLKDETMKVLRQ